MVASRYGSILDATKPKFRSSKFVQPLFFQANKHWLTWRSYLDHGIFGAYLASQPYLVETPRSMICQQWNSHLTCESGSKFDTKHRIPNIQKLPILKADKMSSNFGDQQVGCFTHLAPASHPQTNLLDVHRLWPCDVIQKNQGMGIMDKKRLRYIYISIW